MARVTAMVASNDRQVDDVLAEIVKWERVYGTAIVPLVARSGMLKRITALWNSLGIGWRSVAIPSEMPDATVEQRPSLPDVPDIVAATETVDPMTKALAAGLASRRVVPLNELTRGSTLNVRGKAVMVLTVVDGMSLTTLEMVDDLIGNGARVGIVPVGDGTCGHYAVIKSLTTGGTRQPRKFKVAADYVNTSTHANAPLGILRENDISGRLLEERVDVLVAAGHSDAWHLLVGPRLTLCSRDLARRPRFPDRGLPCANGAGCPVQLMHGRDAVALDGLASVSSCNARVLVLSGCNNIRFGRTAADQLVYQAWRSNALAVVASTSYLGNSPAIHGLLFGLLADGRTLGEAVQEVNKLMGASSGPNPAIGPYFIVGNPNMALRGHPVIPATVRESPHGIVVHVPKECAAHPEGCFVKVCLPNGASRAVVIRDKTESLWCHGAYTTEDVGYFWTRLADTTKDVHDVSLSLERPIPPRRLFEPSTFECISDGLHAWATELAPFVRDGDTGPTAELCRECLAEIPAATRRYRAMAAPTADREWRMLHDAWPEASMEERQEATRREIASLCERLVKCAIVGVIGIRLSRFTLHLRRHSAHPAVATGPACECGQGRLFSRVSELVEIANSERRRVEYRCEACGSLGIDDGRRLFRLMSHDTRLLRGAAIRYRVRGDAPTEETLCISWAAMIAPWLPTDEPIVGDVQSVVIRGGQSEDVACALEVPRDVSAGRHTLVVCATVNGMLWMESRYVNLA